MLIQSGKQPKNKGDTTPPTHLTTCRMIYQIHTILCLFKHMEQSARPEDDRDVAVFCPSLKYLYPALEAHGSNSFIWRLKMLLIVMQHQISDSTASTCLLCWNKELLFYLLVSWHQDTVKIACLNTNGILENLAEWNMSPLPPPPPPNSKRFAASVYVYICLYVYVVGMKCNFKDVSSFYLTKEPSRGELDDKDITTVCT